MALRLRLLVFQLVVVLTFGILAAQLWNMQIIHGAEYADQAENNRLRVVPIAAARGVIYDRNGVQLVSNVPSFTVTVTVADLPEEGPDRDTMLERLGGLIGMARGDIKKRIVEAIARDAMFSPIPLVANASDEMALAVEENAFQLPGIAIQVDANRRYIEGDDLAHILGYVSSISAEEYDRLANEGYLLNDRLGKAGVERTYETTLRGRLGSETAVYDAAGEKNHHAEPRGAYPRKKPSPNDRYRTTEQDARDPREDSRQLRTIGGNRHGPAKRRNPRDGFSTRLRQ